VVVCDDLGKGVGGSSVGLFIILPPRILRGGAV
jgi:hypothetical protein